MIVGKPRRKYEIMFVPVGHEYVVKMLPVVFDSVPISQYYLLACDFELLSNAKQCSRQEVSS